MIYGQYRILLILIRMKNLTCILIAFLLAASASAQKVYFLYFESENASPFYLKMDDKVFSAGAGYFVLPNLVDSTYTISIGFPSATAQYKFRVPMGGKDRGFIIRKFDFGWGLFDLQTLSVIRPMADTWKSSVSYEYRTNDFIALLARASNDTSLFYLPVPIKEDIAVKEPELSEADKKETTQADTGAALVQVANVTSSNGGDPVLTDSLIKTQGDSNSIAVNINNKDSVFNIAVVTDTTAAIKTGEIKTEIQDIVRTDTMAAQLSYDTLTSIGLVQDSVVQPKPLANNETSINADPVAVKDIGDRFVRSTIKRHSESSTSEGFGLVFHDVTDGVTDTIQLIIPNPKISIRQDAVQFEDGMLELRKDTVVVAPPVKIIAAKSCRSVASHNDFLRLRRNMAARDSDEAMLNEAKKFFRNKCVSTEQVKFLSTLFLTDGGKYSFFDAAFSHVTDHRAFPSLAAEISDEYYLKRFKALLGQ